MEKRLEWSALKRKHDKGTENSRLYGILAAISNKVKKLETKRAEDLEPV